MSITLSATKNIQYGASVADADRYFTFQNPASSGTASNLTVTSITSASMGAVNTNGSSSTGAWRMEIQVDISNTWVGIGYFDAGARLTGDNYLTTFVPYDFSSYASALGKNAIAGLRGYVINGYFWMYAGCQVSIVLATAEDKSNVTPPTSVSINVSDNQAPNSAATLSWSGAGNGGGGSNISSYVIYRSSTSAVAGFASWKATSAVTYSVNAPATNGSYWYKVQTISSVAGYDSELSSATAVITTSFALPTAPSSPTLAFNNVYPGRVVALSWTASTGGTNNAFTGYQIQYSTTSGGTYSVLVSSQTAVTYNVTARSDNGSYWYRVMALAPNGNSSFSTPIELKTVFSTPTTPSGVNLDKPSVGKSGAATLSWDASTSPTNNTISGYKIERATASNGTWYTIVASQTELTYAATSPADNNTSYFYRITALAPYANSTLSSVVELKTVWEAPTTPANVRFSKALVAPKEEVDLSWDASTGGINNTLTGYKVERSIYADSGFTVIVASQAATTMKVTARDTTGQSYFYRITALAPTQDSEVSAVAELKASVGAIAAPTNILINGATSSTVAPSTVVNIAWTKSEDGENNAITSYKIYRASTAAGNYEEIGSVVGTVYTYQTTTISDAGARYYKVLAVGAVSNSPQSSYVSITTSLTTSEASTFTMSPTSVDGGSTTTATIVPSNEGYSHKIWITFLSATSAVGTIAPGETAWPYAVSTDWLFLIPNSQSGTATVTLETYSGTILKGRRTTSILITVPANALPTLESFNGIRVDNSVPSAWGVYVVSKSQVDLSMGVGSGIYGSTITGASAYRLTGGGMNISSADPISQRSPLLSNTATTFYGYITDSRGKTNTYTVSVTAEPYFAPKMTVESFRCNNLGVESYEGTYGYVMAKCDNDGLIDEFASVNNKNSVILSSKYRLKNTTNAYTIISTGMTSGTGEVFGAGNIALDKYYEVVYTVTDAIGTVVTFTDDISVAMHLMHIKNNGLGLAIGGPSTLDNTFEVHWDTKFHQDVDFDGDILKNGVALAYGDVGAAATDHDHAVADITDFPASMPASDVYTWAKAATAPTYTNTDVGAAATDHDHVKADITDFPTIPTTLPASDVYSWAKAATKPSYAYSEITSPPSSLPASDVSAWAKEATKPSYAYSEITSPPNRALSGSDGGSASSSEWLNNNATLTYGASGMNYFNINGTAGTNPGLNNTPTSAWYHIIRMNHANAEGYYADLAVSLTTADGMYRRTISAGSNNGWYRMYDSNNVTYGTANPSGGSSGNIYIKYTN